MPRDSIFFDSLLVAFIWRVTLRGRMRKSAGYNATMQLLRQSLLTTRLTLAWFALFVCVAAASPLIIPQSMEIVCSGSGVMKLVVQSDEGVGEAFRHMPYCSLCRAVNAQPTLVQTLSALEQPLAYALQSIQLFRIAALTGAPLPARGPPTFS